MPEQRDLMLVKYMEWLERLSVEFPEVPRPPEVSEDWWRLMLLAYERKPVSGKSLWRKFKEDTRNPILSSFNNHWVEPRDGETLEDRFKAVRRGVWRDLGHREDEFLPEGSWLPKQWYAWRYCCYPGKNMRAFDGKLPSVGHSARRALATLSGRQGDTNTWPDAMPMTALQPQDPAQPILMASHHSQQNPGFAPGNAVQPVETAQGPSSAVPRMNRSTLPTTLANQRLLAAAASMSRVRGASDEELQVQQYLADVQQYAAQMTRLEKAVALAEAFGEHEKAAGFKRQLYEHVQTEPPTRAKRVAMGLGMGLVLGAVAMGVDGHHIAGMAGASVGGNGSDLSGTSSGVGERGFPSHEGYVLTGGSRMDGAEHPVQPLLHSVGVNGGGSSGGYVLTGGNSNSASMPVLHSDADGEGEGEGEGVEDGEPVSSSDSEEA